MSLSFKRWSLYTLFACLLTGLCYGIALQLPFMADDFFQLPEAANKSFANLWQSAIYYYRPLAFSLWRLSYLIFGYHNPFVLHLLNLILHVSNGLLAGWLGDRLRHPLNQPTFTPDWLRRGLITTLFIIYPFSYEAVPWVSAVMHPLSLCLGLLALVSLIKFWSYGGRAWALLSLLFIFLAPFAHENGALVGLFLVGLALLQPHQRWWYIWLLPSLIWGVIWQQVPAAQSGSAAQLQAVDVLGRNSVYLLQAIAYPTSWLGGWVHNQFALAELSLVAVISTGTMALVIVWQWSRGAWLYYGIMWGWLGLFIAPALLFLGFPYLSAAPRVLMFASVGLAWLWTDMIMGWWRERHKPYLRPLAIGLAGLIMGISLYYVNQQMRTYTLGGELIEAVVVETEKVNGAGQAAMFVNLPTWVTVPQTLYTVGEDGAMLMPALEEIETLVSVHTGQRANMAVVRRDEVRESTNLHVGVIGNAPNWDILTKQAQTVYVTRLGEAGFWLDYAGEVSDGTVVDVPLGVFGEMGMVDGCVAELSADRVVVALSWQMSAPVSEFVTVFVHVVDEQGQLIGQGDGDPLGGIYPFVLWQAGVGVYDRRVVMVEGVPAGVFVGLYSRITGERIEAQHPDGQAWPNGGVSLPLLCE